MQAATLLAACTAVTSPTPDPASVRPASQVSQTAAAPVVLGSLRTWPLPELLRAWDVAGDTLLYVTEADRSAIHERDLRTTAEVAVAVPKGREAVQVRLVSGGIAYLAVVGEMYRSEAYELRLRRATGEDVLIERLVSALEPQSQGTHPLGPALDASKDRRTLVWTRYQQDGAQVTTEVRTANADGTSLVTLYRGEGIVFPRLLAGADLVTWERPLGGGEAPGSMETFVVSGSSKRKLGDLTFHVDVAADGRAVVQLGASVELRDGITGAVTSRLQLDGLPGPVAIADGRLGWCSQDGSVSLYDLRQQMTRRFEAYQCYPVISLEDNSLTWLQTASGRSVLVRLALP